jgi:hypothetical protein
MEVVTDKREFASVCLIVPGHDLPQGALKSGIFEHIYVARGDYCEAVYCPVSVARTKESQRCQAQVRLGERAAIWPVPGHSGRNVGAQANSLISGHHRLVQCPCHKRRRSQIRHVACDML